jgi:predicted transcriptional regulator
VKPYRASIEIIAEILKIANGGNVTRTKIMYSAFLNFFQVKQYLPMLTERDLLSYNADTRTFKTTEKGLMLLETYDLLVDLMLKKNEKI